MREGEVVFRVNCGGTDYIDAEGTVWQGDQTRFDKPGWQCRAGQPRFRALPQLGETDDPELYRTSREGDVAYTFDVDQGVYSVVLHLVETDARVEVDGDRSFNVLVCGRLYARAVNALRLFGFSRTGTQEIKGVCVAAGQRLSIDLKRWTGIPFLNALEICREPEGAPINKGLRADALADLNDAMAAEADRSVSFNLDRREDFNFPVTLVGAAGDGPHRAVFSTSLDAGFYVLRLALGVARTSTRFRLIFDGTQIAEETTCLPTREHQIGDAATCSYTLTCPFGGEHRIELKAHRWDQRGEVQIRDVRIEPGDPASEVPQPEVRIASGLWGWSHVLAGADPVIETIDYARWRTVSEVWRWGADIAQMLSATSEARFRLSQQEPFTEIAHRHGFVSSIYGHVAAPDDSEKASFEGTIETATEWAREFSNVAETHSAQTVDLWVVQEDRVGTSRDEITAADNAVRLLASMWDFNPALTVARGSAATGDAALSSDLGHEAAFGPALVLGSASPFLPGGYDDAHVAALFSDHLALQNADGPISRLLLADCRYYSAPDGTGGLSAGDWVVKQCNDWFRMRVHGFHQSGILWVSEGSDCLPESLRENVYAVSLDPMRAAVAVPLEATGLGGRFHWARQAIEEEGIAGPRGAADAYCAREFFSATATAISNNHWRVIRYGLGDGGVLQLDPTATGDFDVNSPALRMGRSFVSTRNPKSPDEEVVLGRDFEVTDRSPWSAPVELPEGVYEIEINADGDNDASVLVTLDGLILGAADREQLRAKARFPAVAIGNGAHRLTLSGRGTLRVHALRARRRGELDRKVAHKDITRLVLSAEAPRMESPPYFGLPDDDVELAEDTPRTVILGLDLDPGSYLLAIRARGHAGRLEIRMDEERFARTTRWKARVACFDVEEETETCLAAVRVHEGGDHEFALAALAGTIELENVAVIPFPVRHTKGPVGGHLVEVEEHLTLTFGAEELAERRKWKTLRDSPVLSLEIQREWHGLACELGLSLGMEHAQRIRVDGQEFADAMAVSTGSLITVEATELCPAVHCVIQEATNARVEMREGVLTLVSGPSQAETIRIDVVNGRELSPDDARATSNALCEEEPELLFADTRNATVTCSAGVPVTRLVKILEPSGGPYYVKENDWWVVRGGQPHCPRQELSEYYDSFRRWVKRRGIGDMPTRPVAWDYLTVCAGEGNDAAVQPYGFIDDVVRPGTGCRHQLAIGEITQTGCRANVLSANAFLPAPRVDFAQSFQTVSLNGEPWAYFDGNTVLLPNRTGTFAIETSSKEGERRSVYLARTAASVRSARWDKGSRSLIIETELPEYLSTAPEGLEYRALVKFDANRFRFISLENAELVKRISAAIIIRFKATTTVTCRFGTFEDEKKTAHEETPEDHTAAKAEEDHDKASPKDAKEPDAAD